MNWYEDKRDGVLIRLHVQPGARRTEVVGLHGDCLKLRLAAPPVDGKANACLIEFLARRLQVKKWQLSIAHGTGTRRKTVFVAAIGLQPAVLLDQESESV